MNRSERRNKEKSSKKINDKAIEATKWINSLSPEKLDFIQSFSKKQNEKENKLIISAIERCYTAGIIEVLDEAVSIDDIEKIMKICSDFLVEDAVKMNKQKQKYGGDLEMAIKKINAIANGVAIRIEQLIGDGVKQKELAETISYEYPNLTKSMIVNSIKKVREDIKEVKNLKEVIEREEAEEKLLYILGEKEEAVEPVEVIKQEEQEEFEIIKEVRILDLKGKYANYHIENEVMIIDDGLSFCKSEEVKEWANDRIKKILLLVDEIKAKEKETLRVLERFM